MQLLLVGDNEDLRYLRELLNRPGDGFLALDHARSSEEALARLDQTKYDLLLCEYKSGDSDGLRLLHEVRKDGQGPPVIFLSDHVGLLQEACGHIDRAMALDRRSRVARDEQRRFRPDTES